MDGNTVSSYLDIFKRLFLTDNQPPFSAGIRSSVRIKQAEKRHFSDPSLACALCGMSNAAYRRPDGVFVVPITALRE